MRQKVTLQIGKVTLRSRIKQKEKKEPIIQKGQEEILDKRIQSAKSQNQEKLGSVQDTEKGSVWLKPGREWPR